MDATSGLAAVERIFDSSLPDRGLLRQRPARDRRRPRAPQARAAGARRRRRGRLRRRRARGDDRPAADDGAPADATSSARPPTSCCAAARDRSSGSSRRTSCSATSSAQKRTSRRSNSYARPSSREAKRPTARPCRERVAEGGRLDGAGDDAGRRTGSATSLIARGDAAAPPTTASSSIGRSRRSSATTEATPAATDSRIDRAMTPCGASRGISAAAHTSGVHPLRRQEAWILNVEEPNYRPLALGRPLRLPHRGSRRPSARGTVLEEPEPRYVLQEAIAVDGPRLVREVRPPRARPTCRGGVTLDADDKPRSRREERARRAVCKRARRHGTGRVVSGDEADRHVPIPPDNSAGRLDGREQGRGSAPTAAMRSAAHVPVATSSSPVVPAFVRSALPPHLSARMRRAPAASGGGGRDPSSSRSCTASWKIVLIGMSCTPVRP